jgi:hypothetical protein
VDVDLEEEEMEDVGVLDQEALECEHSITCFVILPIVAPRVTNRKCDLIFDFEKSNSGIAKNTKKWCNLREREKQLEKEF